MTHVMRSRPANWMPLVSHKRSQNAGVFTLDGDGITFVDDLMAAADGLMKSPLRSHQTTTQQSNPLHFGIADTLVLVRPRKMFWRSQPPSERARCVSMAPGTAEIRC